MPDIILDPARLPATARRNERADASASSGISREQDAWSAERRIAAEPLPVVGVAIAWIVERLGHQVVAAVDTAQVFGKSRP